MPARQASMQQQLLRSRSSTASTRLCSVNATYQGTPGQLQVTADGSVRFTPLDANRSMPNACCCVENSMDECAAQDVLGATHDGNKVVIWNTRHKAQGHKAFRHVVKMRLTCTSESDASTVVTTVQAAVRSPDLQHMTVVINPKSGRGNAERIYTSEIAPLFAAAGIKPTVLHTEYAGHAVEMAKHLDLSCVSVIACVGGDGTVHEVLQGLLARPDWATAVKTPLAQLPGGSSNALCANAGYFNPVAAVHALLRMQVVPLDVIAVQQPSSSKVYYSFLSLTYGIIACMDVGTEPLRWMGGIRVLVGGLQQLITFNKHTADCAVLPVHATTTTTSTSVTASTTTTTTTTTTKPPTPIIDSIVQGIDLSKPLDASTLPAGWVHAGEEPYLMFLCCNLAWLDNDMFRPAVHAGPSTGCMDLLLMRDANRSDALSMLLDSDKIAQHPAVQYQHIKAMIFRPTASSTWLVADGEVIPFEPIIAEVVPGLARLVVTPPVEER